MTKSMRLWQRKKLTKRNELKFLQSVLGNTSPKASVILRLKMQSLRCARLNTERNKVLKGKAKFMVKKNVIGPIPIIVVDKARLDENESFENLKYYLDTNKRQRHKIKYPLDELNFTTKIGKTEYTVSTSFDISGKQTLLEQFKNLVLS
jgi:hypothetical protein